MQVESTTTTEVTPEMLAKAFWEMEATQQAAFFKALKQEVGESNHPFEMQSFYMEKELCEEGRDALMTLAAPVFMYTLMAAKQW